MPVPRAPARILALALAAAAAPAHAADAAPAGAERASAPGAPTRSAGAGSPTRAASEMAVPPVPRESAAQAEAERRHTYRVIAWFAAFVFVGFVVFAVALRRRSPGR
jgi:hypothetical protein